jgi:hypothetical protein
MKKRANDNAQMRREDYAAADSVEEDAGSFCKADASNLKGRKMVKARRSAKNSAASQSSNPFGGWSFAGGASASALAPAPSPMAASYTSSGSSSDSVDYFRKLRGLNRSFHSWVREQAKENASLSWKEGLQVCARTRSNDS